MSTQGPFPSEQSISSPSARPWPGEQPRPDAPAEPAAPAAPAPPVEAPAGEAEPPAAESEPPAVVEPATWPASPEAPATQAPAPELAAVGPLERAEAATPEPVPVEPVDASDQHAHGELEIPQGYRVLEGGPFGTARTVGVVVSRFNGSITGALLKGALEELERLGVRADAVTVMPVPGAFELPLAAMALAKSRRYACVVALGCVIRGETPHFDYVASEAASGLQLAGLETGIPVAFGVLTVDTIEQAQARIDKGAEAVRTALELADVFAKLRAVAQSAG